MDLSGKIVLISGAASGLGLATSKLAAERGATIVMSDLNEEALRSAADGLNALPRVCNVADPEECRDLIDFVIAQHGQLDGMVNAAGVMQTAPFLEVTPDDFDRVIAVNLRGAYFLAQAAATRMVERSSGSIVLFSSTAGRAGRPLASHYAAAKAGVINLVRSAATALAPQGVRVNAVCPGLIETPMIEQIRQERSAVQAVSVSEVQNRWKSTVPLGRLGQPIEVAEAVTLLLSDASSYITGEQLGITGGTDGS